MTINKSDYLLCEEKTVPQVTKMLNKIFDNTGKKISVNIIRHAFLTDHYENLKSMPTIIEMEKLAQHMAHSTQMQMLYIKR